LVVGSTGSNLVVSEASLDHSLGEAIVIPVGMEEVVVTEVVQVGLLVS
jgi:hypothetical protein